MKVSTKYDYIIIGTGIAGLQLAYELSKDSFFDKKSIALIDKSKKNTNDKTLSFWEKGQGNWDSIVAKSWDEALVYACKKKHSLKLLPYTYKTINALDFYKKIKSELSKSVNFYFINEEVISVEDTNKPKIKTNKNFYEAKHVFDSRVPKDFFYKNKFITLIQHFRGWVIKTDSPAFESNKFTMMDFRLKDGNQTCFMYILPFNKNKALVEFTYFTKNLVEDKTYESYLKKYISNQLNIKKYKIFETENGSIPMTNFRFERYSKNNITKIGTAGGWVKGSTGYSFKHTEKKVTSIIYNLKNNLDPSFQIFKKRFKFYDKVFLKVLHDENHKGEWIFSQFYSKNPLERIFKFLDEETSFTEELKIMKSLFSFSFIKAFFKTL